ncbi:MAG: hypothetical protein RJA07_1968 [Bacteroidota bacterium]|jgi:SecD/SecF fusion protein
MRYIYLFAFVVFILLGSCGSNKSLHKHATITLRINSTTQKDFENTIAVLKNRLNNCDNLTAEFAINQNEKTIIINAKGDESLNKIDNLLVSGKLEFSEMYDNSEFAPYLLAINKAVQKLNEQNKTTQKIDSSNLLDVAKSKTEDGGIFKLMTPMIDNEGVFTMHTPLIGYVLESDIDKLNTLLNLPKVQQEMPEGAAIKYGNKRNSFLKTDKDIFSVYAVKKSEYNMVSTPNNQLVEKANVEITSQKANEIYFKFNDKAAAQWQALTQKNIKKAIAIMFDNKVYSAPTVQNVITGGRCSMTGDFTLQEAKDMVVVLNSGTLPAPVSIIQKTIE